MLFFEHVMPIIFPIMFFGCFIVIFGTFIVYSIKGVKEWKSNNNSPELTVEATVVAKRTNTHHHNNVNGHRSSSTTYYVTFEVGSGDRMELKVRGNQYGMLVEGDKGKLTFQGTRYLNFNRN